MQYITKTFQMLKLKIGIYSPSDIKPEINMMSCLNGNNNDTTLDRENHAM
jgi:hypothetical protein